MMRKKLTFILGVIFLISCMTTFATAEVKMEFTANSDFGGVQGANGWLYEYSTDDGKTYKELDVYSNACWTTRKADGTGNENWGICSANWNLISHDVILVTTFYAPYSGIVTVGSANGIVAPSSADIEYRLTYNGTPIKDWQTFPKDTTQWTYYNGLAPVEVTKGDKIRYEIRLAENADSLKQCWHIPKVTYKEIYINNPYFSTNTITVKPGAAKKISIITPDDAQEKAKGIVSANPELVSVFQLDNFWYVQGVNAGDATINLLSDSGEIFDQCTVTVSSQIVTEADITKTTYNSNSDFSDIQGSPFRYQYSENGKDFYDFDLSESEGRQWAKKNQGGGHDWNYPFIQGSHLYLIAGGPSCSELFIAPFSGIISFNTASAWSAKDSDSIKIQRNGEQIFPAPGVEYRPTVGSWFKLGSMDVTAGDEIRVIFDRDSNAGNSDIWYQYTMNCQNGTYQSDGTVKNTASIDTEVIKLIDGETIDVPLTILSKNGEKEKFTLTSSDLSVASVAQEDGVWRISANSTGRAVLSVVGENSGVTDTCEVCVFDSSGIIVDEFALVPDADKVSARIAVQMDGSSLQPEAQVIIAGYDSDNNMQCMVPNHQIYENNGIYKTDMILPNENIQTVKAFLWDGFETLKPITKTQVGDIETLHFSRISPDDPAIAYIGRWTGDSNGYTSGWARPYFKVDFTGTSLRINLTTKTNLAVTIDGQEHEISNAQGMVVLAEGLSEGTHHAQVTTTTSYNGVISLKELFVDAGEKCITPKLNSKHIEFIGDSITAAEGGYSWMLGEELGLEHNRVCYPGIALTDGTGYYAINSVAPLFRWGMESAYLQSTMPGTGSYNLWDTKKLIPDFIVVNLGTNDNVSGSGTREIECFGKAYERLLNTLRTAYPNAEIFALEMVSVSSSDRDARQETIKNTVETMGDSKIHYVSTKDWNAEISGDNIHPTQNGHRTITNKLKEILQSYL